MQHLKPTFRPIRFSRSGPTDERWLITGAFAVVYLVWGSTYLVNWYAIQSIPPFLMSGARFIVAGGLLYGFNRVRGVPHPSLPQWRSGLLMGFLFLAVGTGGVVWAEQFIDTSIAALVVAFEPLLVVLLIWRLRKSRPGLGSWFGTSLGILGMGLLVGQDRFISDEKTLWGIVVIGISITAWAVASIEISRVALPRSRLQAAAIQMLCGGVCLLLISLLTGEYRHFRMEEISLRAGVSWIYLVLFGSLLAYSAFNYLLSKVSPDKVATTTYVNPVVALLLGWGINGEVISTQSLVAAALLLSGVVFINSRYAN